MPGTLPQGSVLAEIIAALPAEFDADERLSVALNSLNLKALQTHRPGLAAFLAHEYAAGQRRAEHAARTEQRVARFLAAVAAAAPSVLAQRRNVHAMRPASSGRIDARCRTCRNDDGEPLPWPCEPFLRYDQALRPDVEWSQAAIAALRAAGVHRNHPTNANRQRMETLLALASTPEVPNQPSLDRHGD